MVGGGSRFKSLDEISWFDDGTLQTARGHGRVACQLIGVIGNSRENGGSIWPRCRSIYGEFEIAISSIDSWGFRPKGVTQGGTDGDGKDRARTPRALVLSYTKSSVCHG